MPDSQFRRGCIKCGRTSQDANSFTCFPPRIRLLRSSDERSHGYLGYVLQFDGMVGDEERTSASIFALAHNLFGVRQR